KRAHLFLLGLVIDLARNEFGTAEIDQREHHVITSRQVARHVDEGPADGSRKCREFRDRHSAREAVVETTELEASLGNEMHCAGVVELDRNLTLGRCWRRGYGYGFRGLGRLWRRIDYRHVFDCPVAGESGRRDVHLHAGAEDVLQRIAL